MMGKYLYTCLSCGHHFDEEPSKTNPCPGCAALDARDSKLLSDIQSRRYKVDSVTAAELLHAGVGPSPYVPLQVSLSSEFLEDDGTVRPRTVKDIQDAINSCGLENVHVPNPTAEETEFLSHASQEKNR